MQNLERSRDTDKVKVNYSPVYCVSSVYNFTVFQYESDLPKVKRNLIRSITIFGRKLSCDLRLDILDKQKALVKSQIWVESLFQKVKLGNSSLKIHKIMNQSSLVLPNLSGLFYLVSGIFSGIACGNKFQVIPSSSRLHFFCFGIFYNFENSLYF